MKRLVIVYSPNSTRFSFVEEKVIIKARTLKGWMVAKFEVEEAPVWANVLRLKKIIRKGDLVLAAGGDGTAAVAMNAIIESGEIATLAVMPFGNFNDFAETLGRMSFDKIIRRFEEGRYRDFYPLNVNVNGRHLVYAGMYYTVGMMAEATGVMKQMKTRKKLQKARNRMMFSARKMFGWYMKNKRRKDFLPVNSKLNGEFLKRITTDYVAMNGRSIASLIPGKGWMFKEGVFWSGTMRNRSIFRAFFKFLGALEEKLPGGETKGDVLEFPSGADVFAHAEGEGEMLREVRKIEIQKAKESVRVIAV